MSKKKQTEGWCLYLNRKDNSRLKVFVLLFTATKISSFVQHMKLRELITYDLFDIRHEDVSHIQYNSSINTKLLKETGVPHSLVYILILLDACQSFKFQLRTRQTFELFNHVSLQIKQHLSWNVYTDTRTFCIYYVRACGYTTVVSIPIGQICNSWKLPIWEFMVNLAIR